MALFKGREMVFNHLKMEYFQSLKNQNIQVKAGNNSESLLNEISQIVYSLYQSREITKKVYNNIIKAMQI